MIDEIKYKGILRRMGSLPIDLNQTQRVFATFEETQNVLDDSDIKRLLTSPTRRVSRKIFGSKWKLDQRSHGSCNGYAGAGGLGKQRYLRGIQDGKLFSGAYLYSLMNGGQDNGSNLADGVRLLETNGCSEAELVKWNQIYRSQYNTKAADSNARLYKGLSGLHITTLQGLRSAGASGYLIIAAVHVSDNFMVLRNGISGLCYGQGNHAILLQDMILRNGTELFDHDGSWGLGWGDEGNSYLVLDHFNQTIKRHYFYALHSTVEGAL